MFSILNLILNGVSITKMFESGYIIFENLKKIPFHVKFENENYMRFLWQNHNKIKHSIFFIYKKSFFPVLVNFIYVGKGREVHSFLPLKSLTLYFLLQRMHFFT